MTYCISDRLAEIDASRQKLISAIFSKHKSLIVLMEMLKEFESSFGCYGVWDSSKGHLVFRTGENGKVCFHEANPEELNNIFGMSQIEKKIIAAADNIKHLNEAKHEYLKRVSCYKAHFEIEKTLDTVGALDG